MSEKSMNQQWQDSWLEGENAAWLDYLYENYLNSPASVPTQWKNTFDALQSDPSLSLFKDRDIAHSSIQSHFRKLARAADTLSANKPCADLETIEHDRKQVRVLQLINSYRFMGHKKARLNPLQPENDNEVPELSLAYHQLSSADENTVFDTGSLFFDDRATLADILRVLQKTYCQSVGSEFMHIVSTEEKRWIQQQLESVLSKPNFHYKARKRILRRMVAAEGLEQYLHSRYVGQKRFSLEGAESLIPMLDELIQNATLRGIEEIVIGMAHRGRLNVLVNILGKTPAELFKEFEGSNGQGDHSGDVKYHMGFSSQIKTPDSALHLTLAFNPSHLEIVAPVVEGSVRARQERLSDRIGSKILPVQIHGDAAFSGQGVVMETFQMSQSRGYSTKGTLHIVINNQIGFTTSNSKDSRSTTYCTDVAKMVNAPIFHVNGDDPEAVVYILRLALDYRMIFNKDVIIDMVCYRRHGHNEADEPSATQPMMYKAIKALPTTTQLYMKILQQAQLLTGDIAKEMINNYRDRLDAGECVAPNIISRKEHFPHDVRWKKFIGQEPDQDIDTSINLSILKDLALQLEVLPKNFALHPRVEKIMSNRHKMIAGALPIDWGFGETLAYVTLLNEQYNIRLSGQDSGRGTFFHRHAVWHNQLKNQAYIPLRNLSATDKEKQPGCFLVIDSLLSEEAVLAFEYGYTSTDPNTLVIWEAQFGDFANNAQVVIDQFISAGEQKWQRLCGLVMLLPHGYEGQGAEHSSARLERYLQLCAQNNMQVCIPTTPAQVFHMLRRQMIRNIRKPLICLSPKSLLRHKLAVSTLEDFSEGQFKRVIDEVDPLTPASITRIVLCSGKVYYDLLELRQKKQLDHIVIIRIEQLYPFPQTELKTVLSRYDKARQIIWCQEEPINQGAWYNTRHHLEAVLSGDQQLHYAGREASAAPAVGVAKIHIQQQQGLVRQALGINK
jgi:2-oxoglutarate dehydrogenase E1 component